MSSNADQYLSNHVKVKFDELNDVPHFIMTSYVIIENGDRVTLLYAKPALIETMRRTPVRYNNDNNYKGGKRKSHKSRKSRKSRSRINKKNMKRRTRK